MYAHMYLKFFARSFIKSVGFKVASDWPITHRDSATKAHLGQWSSEVMSFPFSAEATWRNHLGVEDQPLPVAILDNQITRLIFFVSYRHGRKFTQTVIWALWVFWCFDISMAFVPARITVLWNALLAHQFKFSQFNIFYLLLKIIISQHRSSGQNAGKLVKAYARCIKNPGRSHLGTQLLLVSFSTKNLRSLRSALTAGCPHPKTALGHKLRKILSLCISWGVSPNSCPFMRLFLAGSIIF